MSLYGFNDCMSYLECEECRSFDASRITVPVWMEKYIDYADVNLCEECHKRYKCYFMEKRIKKLTSETEPKKEI